MKFIQGDCTLAIFISLIQYWLVSSYACGMAMIWKVPPKATAEAQFTVTSTPCLSEALYKTVDVFLGWSFWILAFNNQMMTKKILIRIVFFKFNLVMFWFGGGGALSLQVFLFHLKPSKFCCFSWSGIIKEIGKVLFLHICMLNFWLYVRRKDLKEHEPILKMEFYCECFHSHCSCS